MHEVTTAEELDALPIGSVVREQRDGYLWGKRDGGGWSVGNSGSPLAAVHIVEEYAPLTVLFRPDAPQPVTENSAPAVLASVDRAALLADLDIVRSEDYGWDRRDAAYDRVMAVLAARGDAAPTEVEWGVRYDAPHPNPDRVYPASGEHAARLLAADSECTTRLMRRDVHRSPWREVTDRA